MLVHGLQQPLDVLILCLVEILLLSCFGGVLVQCDGPEAVALTGGLCVYSVEVGGRFESRGKLVRVVL